MIITKIDHVALNVKNLEQSAEWYKRVLGFQIFHKWTHTWMINRKAMKIGLFERPNAIPFEDIDNRIAIIHFAFLADAKNFDDIQAELKKLGIPFDPPEDTGIAYSIFISDPDGHQVEITTYHDRKA